MYKRQGRSSDEDEAGDGERREEVLLSHDRFPRSSAESSPCLLYTSDAADERSSVDLGGRRIIKKKNHLKLSSQALTSRKYSYYNVHLRH